MTTGIITVRRLVSIGPGEVAGLDALFDDDVRWDAAEGARFLSDPNNLFLLAECDGVPCGFLTAHRLQRFDARRAEVLLYEVGVDDAYQRRGAARTMVEGLRHWAAEVGASEIWVLTEVDNEVANAFYLGTGGAPDEDDVRLYTYPVTGT